MIKITRDNIRSIKIGDYIGYFTNIHTSIFIIKSIKLNEMVNLSRIYSTYHGTKIVNVFESGLVFYNFHLLNEKEINYYNKLATFQ